jgi:hypothetical protein
VHGRGAAHFKPEFLNRLDDIVVFHALSTDDLSYPLWTIQLAPCCRPSVGCCGEAGCTGGDRRRRDPWLARATATTRSTGGAGRSGGSYRPRSGDRLAQRRLLSGRDPRTRCDTVGWIGRWGSEIRWTVSPRTARAVSLWRRDARPPAGLA